MYFYVHFGTFVTSVCPVSQDYLISGGFPTAPEPPQRLGTFVTVNTVLEDKLRLCAPMFADCTVVRFVPGKIGSSELYISTVFGETKTWHYGYDQANTFRELFEVVWRDDLWSIVHE